MQYNSVESLFKYTSLDYGLESIRNNTIYCPTYEKLNDPFDSKILFNTKPRKKVIDYYKENKDAFVAETQTIIITLPQKEKGINEIIELRPIEKDYLIYSEYGLYSMTTDKYNLLMWSHYADKHKAICIEWERKESNIFSNNMTCFPINYSSYFPEYDIDKQNEIEIAKAKFGNKYDAWSYEKEWRFITKNSNVNIKIDSKILGVYFGCKCTFKSEKIKEIIEICKKMGIKMFKAKMIENEYRIEYDEIEEKI